MATFSSIASFTAELSKFTKQLGREAVAKITHDQAVRGQAIIREQASADLGGDPKFSGWTPEVATQVKPGENGSAWLSPTRTGAGPLTVAESGRHHGNATGFQGPGVNKKTGITKKLKSGGVGKVKANKGKKWNGYTTGKHTASKAVKRMEDESLKVAEDGMSVVLRQHFDVS